MTYLQSAKLHIQARLTGSFDLETVVTRDELKQALEQGKTVAKLLDDIEIKFTSITSIILARNLFHQSKNYKAGVNKGFKLAFQNLGITKQK